jgi:hypothetical protein
MTTQSDINIVCAYIQEQKLKVVEPKLKDWAEAIICGIGNASKIDSKTVEWLESELNDIADKYYLIGYEDGENNAWWKEQEYSKGGHGNVCACPICCGELK